MVVVRVQEGGKWQRGSAGYICGRSIATDTGRSTSDAAALISQSVRLTEAVPPGHPYVSSVTHSSRSGAWCCDHRRPIKVKVTCKFQITVG